MDNHKDADTRFFQLAFDGFDVYMIPKFFDVLMIEFCVGFVLFSDFISVFRDDGAVGTVGIADDENRLFFCA